MNTLKSLKYVETQDKRFEYSQKIRIQILKLFMKDSLLHIPHDEIIGNDSQMHLFIECLQMAMSNVKDVMIEQHLIKQQEEEAQ
ncbi:MAG: hypothetical protein ACRCZB_06265 [Bacteroidales bacterium]